MNPTSQLPASCFSYNPATDIDNLQVTRGNVRRISRDGRAGVLLDDAFGGILLGGHNLADAKGSLAFWVMATEDLHPAARCERESMNVEDAQEFTLISDRETVKDSRAAHFAVVWSSFWTPSFFVKRYPGRVYEAFKNPVKAVAAAGHFPFRAGKWYQLVYSWDVAANRHRIFANGILVAHSDAHARDPLVVKSPGPFLCIGSSMFVNGSIAGYREEFGSEECARLFREEAVCVDAGLQQELEHCYLGRGLKRFSAPEGGEWKPRLSLSLTEESHLRRFQIQGCPDAPRIDAEGLRITTSPQDPLHDFSVLDLNHVYLWSRDIFEGDLYLSYEFQNLKRGGLSLLMIRCTGMQREDFWKTHRPRTNGIMRPILSEDIRNYHWEYLREMDDVRNDFASHAMLKNPWQKPMGFGIHGELYPLGQWNLLEFLQVGPRIQCAINGEIVLDCTDGADGNSGPVFNTGRFAIRCMTRTDIRFRNLNVRTRSLWDD